jgi:crotonobetainyl-CoA:carnitine CoA-transferase CaiB-like acyl-CoA transferase
MTVNPLAGIRVLDLTTVVVGPVCTLRLADYGADVIKLEPLDGDLLRSLGGPSPTGSHSGIYLHLNRNKRAIALDLKDADARQAVDRLIDTCDVVVANMRLDALERLGLSPQDVRASRPRLVHCVISGYGPAGPYRGLPAYDSVVQGVSGVAGLTERRDGKPSYAPLLLADHIAGEIAAGAIMSALVERERTGVGSALEVPMHETIAALVLYEHLGPATFTPPLGPPGDRRILSPDNRPFQTADGWISVTANTDAQAHGLLQAIGRTELISDPRFGTVAARFRNVDAWFEIRALALRDRTTHEWIERFRRYDVAAMPCHSLETLVEDTHLQAVGMLAEAVHPTEGAIRTIGPTVLTDGIAPPAGRPAPPLGWDTREVLEEAGLDSQIIQALFGRGAAIDGRRPGVS